METICVMSRRGSRVGVIGTEVAFWEGGIARANCGVGD